MDIQDEISTANAPSPYPLTTVTRCAIRSTHRPDRDRTPLHFLGAGHDADPPAATRRQSARVRRESRLSQVSRTRAWRERSAAGRDACLHSHADRMRSEGVSGYARREETRWEHLGELQAYLDVRSFRRDDKRALAHVAIEQATGSDRGDVIVSAMIEYLRERRILLPAAVTLEKIALAARALARKRAYKSLVEGLPPQTIAGLEALLVVAKDEERTPLAWLREWPEAPRQKNLVAVVDRLEAVRKLGVGADREKRIHRARYAAIAREIAIVSAQHLSRFDTPRRLAALVVFAREMETVLTDAALAMSARCWALFGRCIRT